MNKWILWCRHWWPPWRPLRVYRIWGWTKRSRRSRWCVRWCECQSRFCTRRRIVGQFHRRRLACSERRNCWANNRSGRPNPPLDRFLWSFDENMLLIFHFIHIIVNNSSRLNILFGVVSIKYCKITQCRSFWGQVWSTIERICVFVCALQRPIEGLCNSLNGPSQELFSPHLSCDLSPLC